MDGCVYGIDYGDALWMCTYLHTHSFVYIECVHLLCQSLLIYLSKGVQKIINKTLP